MLYSTAERLECQRGVVVGRRSHRQFLIGCGSWDCPRCGPRKRAEFAARALRMRRSYRTQKFITYTARPAACSACVALGGRCARCVRDFNRRHRVVRRWQRRVELRRAAKAGKPPPPPAQSVWTNEQGARSNHLHKHELSGHDYIDQRDLSRACVRAGLGVVVDIRKVSDPRGGLRYLTKYLAKAKGQKWGRGARRAQSSPGLKLPPPADPEAWRVMLLSGHWWSKSRDRPDDARMMPRRLADDDPRVLCLGSLTTSTVPPTKKGTVPVSVLPQSALASVPDAATARVLSAQGDQSELHSLDLEKKCVSTRAVEQEIAA